jgi:hypothetical protein
LVVFGAFRLAGFEVRSGICFLLEEGFVRRAHLHRVDDQKATAELDRDDFERDAIGVEAEEHNAIVLKRRVLWRGLPDNRVGGFDYVAAAATADAVLGSGLRPTDLHRTILSDTMKAVNGLGESGSASASDWPSTRPITMSRGCRATPRSRSAGCEDPVGLTM